MSAAGGLATLDDANLPEVLAGAWGALVLTKSGCGACTAYQAELEALLGRGELARVALGKLVLDRPGTAGFKRANPWLVEEVRALPYTVLYRNGERVDGFAASKATYLLERLVRAGLTGATARCPSARTAPAAAIQP